MVPCEEKPFRDVSCSVLVKKCPPKPAIDPLAGDVRFHRSHQRGAASSPAIRLPDLMRDWIRCEGIATNEAPGHRYERGAPGLTANGT